jgi:hypothetical protein
MEKTQAQIQKQADQVIIPTPTQSSLQTRSFEAQGQKEATLEQQSDLEIQLHPVQQSGHTLNKISLSPAAETPSIQSKLTIGQPGDPYEQEADRVAAQVVQQINSPQRLTQSSQPSVQRQGGQNQIPAGTASTEFETALNQSRSGGQPLESQLRAKIEQAMGTDFEGVRIHHNRSAHQLNQAIHSRAFTSGQDIFFKQGEYNPSSRQGQELIAHELTHVAQQQGSAIQRKTANIEPLPDRIIGKQLIGKSTTRKIQDAIEAYNAIAIDDRGYEKQIDKLNDITTKTAKWSSKHAAEKGEKLAHIARVSQEAFSETQAVQQQLGATVDIDDTSQSNKTNKLKTVAKVGGLALGVAATLPLSIPVGIIGGIGYGIHKYKTNKKKQKDTERAKTVLVISLDNDAKEAEKIAKVHYKANDQKSLLNEVQLGQISDLSKTPKGIAWLRKAGFKPTDEVVKYSTGKDFKNWENEAAPFKMQVATYQYFSGLQNTPGYHKALSALGKKDKIYENDADAWAKTLQTPKQLSDQTKEALTQNNQKYQKNTSPDLSARKGQGHLGSESELLKTNAAAMNIVQRIFIVLQKGLTFTKDGENFQNWEQPVAVALSHGGRVNIRIPKVAKGEEQHALFGVGKKQDELGRNGNISKFEVVN